MNIIRVLLVSSFLLIAIGLSAQTESNVKSEFAGSGSLEFGNDPEIHSIGVNIGLNYISPCKFSFGIGLGYVSRMLSDEKPDGLTSNVLQNYPSDELKTIRILGGRSMNLNRRGTLRFHLQSGIGFIESTEIKNIRRVSGGFFTLGFGSGFAWDKHTTNSLSFELAPKVQFLMSEFLSFFIIGRGQFIPEHKPLFSLGIGMDVGRFVFKK